MRHGHSWVCSTPASVVSLRLCAVFHSRRVVSLLKKSNCRETPAPFCLSDRESVKTVSLKPSNVKLVFKLRGRGVVLRAWCGREVVCVGKGGGLRAWQGGACGCTTLRSGRLDTCGGRLCAATTALQLTPISTRQAPARLLVDLRNRQPRREPVLVAECCDSVAGVVELRPRPLPAPRRSR